VDHTHDVTVPTSDALDTRLMQPSVIPGKPDSVNGNVGLSGGSAEKSAPAPVVIHVGDRKPPTLPNGFINAGAKVIANTSKGHRPVSLGTKYVHTFNMSTE